MDNKLKSGRAVDKPKRIRVTKAELNQQLDAAYVLLNSALVGRAKMSGQLGKQFGGERDLYLALGYLKVPTYETYLDFYTRDGLATRLADAPADEAWRLKPVLVEGDGKDFDELNDPSELQKQFNELDDEHELLTLFNEADRACAISRFAILYLGLPGEPKDPVEKATELAYITVHDEGTAEVVESSISTDMKEKRFGLPEFYNIAIDEKKGSKIRVHYTRVVHVKEGRDRKNYGRIYGVPRLEKMLNRLFDLEKVIGSGSEAFWLLIYRGLALQAREGMDMPAPGSDAYGVMQDEIEEYMHGLRRYMRLQGMEVKDLGGEPVDAKGQFDVVVAYLSGASRTPQRILLGSERGELASSQDEFNWTKYIESRQTKFCEPRILRNFIDSAGDLGILKVPDKYFVVWPSLFQLNNLEKATLANTVASALNTASGGMPEMIMPFEEFARRYLDYVMKPEQIRERDEKQAQVLSDAEARNKPKTITPDEDEEDENVPVKVRGDKKENRVSTQEYVSNALAVLNGSRKVGRLVGFGVRGKQGIDFVWRNEHENSAMIAFVVPESIKADLVIQYPFISPELFDNLHITIVFLGDMRTLNLEKVNKAVAALALSTKPIKLKIQGLARFTSDGATNPVVLTVDSSNLELTSFYELATTLLDDAGVPYHKDHGFIPHMTVAFVDNDAPMPVDKIEPFELNFDIISLVVGGSAIPFPMGVAERTFAAPSFFESPERPNSKKRKKGRSRKDKK